MIVGRRSSPLPGILLVLAVPVLFAIGIGIRLWVWPARGLAGDIDQFVLWVHGIAVNGWPNAYDQNLSFPAVMAWVWGALAWLEPAFRTVTDASDPAIGALMKLPASLADLGVAAAVGWWFRDRPWAAVAAMAAVLVWPVTWYVSAWWGQVEALYVLPAVLALLAARAGRPSLVAVFLALSLVTSPRALPLAVPFAAWFLATQGFAGTLRATLVGAAVCVLAWLPFIAAGGPGSYLRGVSGAANAEAAGLSLGAWNPWWVIQELGARGELVADTTQVLGPVTLRHVGLGIAAILAAVVFAGVYRRPSPQGLALGLAAVTLVTFVAATAMRPLSAYPAFVFLLMACNGRALAFALLAFSISFAANLVDAAPVPGLTVPAGRALGLAGAAVITLVAVVALLWMGRTDRLEHDDVGAPLHSLWPTMR